MVGGSCIASNDPYREIVTDGAQPRRYGYFSRPPTKGLERAREKRIVRAVFRGEWVDNVDDAKVAIDFADWLIGRRAAAWFHLVPVLSAVILVGPFVWAWSHGWPVNRTNFAVMAVMFGVLPVFVEMWAIRGRRLARRSREANRALLKARRVRDSRDQ
jgi:hypothetical protein